MNNLSRKLHKDHKKSRMKNLKKIKILNHKRIKLNKIFNKKHQTINFKNAANSPK